MNQYLKCIICIFIMNSTLGLAEFSSSLEKKIGINGNRIVEIGRKVRVRFGTFSRGSTAAASYNPLFNIIKFNKNIKSKKTGRLQSVEELRLNNPLTYQISISTIFHELGHAELDTIIEESKGSDDRHLFEVLKYEVQPWFKRNFPRVRSWTAVHELYGYYRTSVIEVIFGEVGELLLQNGINQYQNTCFLGYNLKKLIGTQTRDEFSKIQDFRKVQFRKDINVKYIFINGKDYNLESGAEKFKEEWFTSIWDYIEKVYKLPKNSSELIKYLNDWPELSFIKECREKLWDNYHSIK